MRHYGDRVEMEASLDGDGRPRPARFVWRNRAVVVAEILEDWVTTPNWWLTGAAPGLEIRWWRVRAVADAGSLILDLRELGGEWTVETVHD